MRASVRPPPPWLSALGAQVDALVDSLCRRFGPRLRGAPVLSEAEQEALAADSEMGALLRLLEAVHRDKCRLERLDVALAHVRAGLECGLERAQLRRLQRQAEEELQRSFLDDTSVVLCTLSGAGLPILGELERPFDAMVIDEAAQSVELSTLVALAHDVETCVLVVRSRARMHLCHRRSRAFS